MTAARLLSPSHITRHSHFCVLPSHRLQPFIPTATPFSRVFHARRPALRVCAGDGSKERRADAVLGDPTSLDASPAIDFLMLCHQLKTTKRKGWVNHGIEGPESIADHMYRMSLMALIVGDLPGVNRERCIKIAIVHDMAEAIVGDITPSDGVPKAEKSRLERAALNEMCQILGGGFRADEIKELWEEYENNSSVEANLVKDFDKSMGRSWMSFFFPQKANFKLI